MQKLTNRHKKQSSSRIYPLNKTLSWQHKIKPETIKDKVIGKLQQFKVNHPYRMRCKVFLLFLLIGFGISLPKCVALSCGLFGLKLTEQTPRDQETLTLPFPTWKNLTWVSFPELGLLLEMCGICVAEQTSTSQAYAFPAPGTALLPLAAQALSSPQLGMAYRPHCTFLSLNLSCMQTPIPMELNQIFFC